MSIDKVKTITLEKIESSTKLGALLIAAFTSILSVVVFKAQAGDAISIELFWAMIMLFIVFFSLQLMYYIRFYLEKIVFFKEEKLKSDLQLAQLDKELQKMELEVKIRELAVA